MSTAYVPVPALLGATVTLPQDLVDLRNAASVNVPFQALANAVAYLQESLTVRRSFACADANPRICAERAKSHDISTTTFWYPQDQDANSSTAATTRNYFEWGQLKFDGANAVAAQGRHMLFQLDPYLIHGATLDRVKLYLGGQGHAALPLMMPALGVIRVDTVAGSLASCYTGNMLDDTSANIAAYDAIHNIEVICDQNNTIDREVYNYFAVVCNEGNTNALAELRLRQFVLRMTARRFAAGVTP